MIRLDVIRLIDRQKKKGVFDTEVISEREVPAEVMSIKYREAYIAMANGFRPEAKFKLSACEEYWDEPQIVWGTRTYNVIRHYPTPDGGVELICERSEEDV